MTSVAGAGWETMCGNVSHKGRHARGVGGTFVRSAGSGDLTITFRTGRAGLWLTSTALQLFQSSANAPPASSIKVFTDDHTAFPTARAVWEGSSVRAVLAVNSCADAEDDGAAGP